MNNVVGLPKENMQSAISRIEGRAKTSGGEPPYDGGMEARVAKLESGIEHLGRDVSDIKAELRLLRADQRSDFRATWIGIMALALGLAGLMAKGFHWL